MRPGLMTRWFVQETPGAFEIFAATHAGFYSDQTHHQGHIFSMLRGLEIIKIILTRV